MIQSAPFDVGLQTFSGCDVFGAQVDRRRRHFERSLRTVLTMAARASAALIAELEGAAGSRSPEVRDGR